MIYEPPAYRQASVSKSFALFKLFLKLIRNSSNKKPSYQILIPAFGNPANVLARPLSDKINKTLK
jgi:hypothetical protein